MNNIYRNMPPDELKAEINVTFYSMRTKIDKLREIIDAMGKRIESLEKENDELKNGG